MKTNILITLVLLFIFPLLSSAVDISIKQTAKVNIIGAKIETDASPSAEYKETREYLCKKGDEEVNLTLNKTYSFCELEVAWSTNKDVVTGFDANDMHSCEPVLSEYIIDFLGQDYICFLQGMSATEADE